MEKINNKEDANYSAKDLSRAGYLLTQLKVEDNIIARKV